MSTRIMNNLQNNLITDTLHVPPSTFFFSLFATQREKETVSIPELFLCYSTTKKPHWNNCLFSIQLPSTVAVVSTRWKAKLHTFFNKVNFVSTFSRLSQICFQWKRCPLVLFVISLDMISWFSRFEESVQVGNPRVASLLFADDVVLFALYGVAGKRTSSSKSEAMLQSWKRVDCFLQLVAVPSRGAGAL